MSFRGSGAGGGFEFRIWFINGVKIEDSAQRQMSVNARMIKNTYIFIFQNLKAQNCSSAGNNYINSPIVVVEGGNIDGDQNCI